MTDSEYALLTRGITAVEGLVGAVDRLARSMKHLAFALDVLNANYAGTLQTPQYVPPRPDPNPPPVQ